MQRGTSMSTGMHVDPAMVDSAALADDEDDADVPPGAVRFPLEADEIADAIAADSA